MKIQSKLINHLTLKGRKETGEKNFIKSIKELQKTSIKCSRKIIQIALIYSTPLFKLHKMRLKKRRKKTVREIPGFLRNRITRTSLALKFLLKSAQNNSNSNIFWKNLSKEILALSKLKEKHQPLKNETQKNVLIKRRLFRYYRWK